MSTFILLCQLVVALGIYNVWLVRPGRATPFRGGGAGNMREEFAVYGLPYWFMLVIGTLKLTCATLLLIGVWFPILTIPAAIVLGVFMMGAVAMHVKVKDPPTKALPSVSVLVLCAIVAAGSIIEVA